MRHPKVREWDRKLKKVCDELDAWLEEHYGGIYRLHPNRPAEGSTANPEMDGLFNIQAVFTPGYGSERGRGYFIDIYMSTLDQVDPEVRKSIDEAVLSMLADKLEQEFPGRKLEIGLDGNMIKIWGDLSLGSV